MAKFNWTGSQKQAIYDRGETLLVSAAAGSGKTAVLTQRAVSLLTDRKNPVDADKLLMVTFSRAAAAEMKERINRRLEEALLEEPGNPLLVRQQLLMNQANISTISSYCLDLVRRNFTRLDLTPDFQIAQENLVETLKKAGVETVISFMMDTHRKDFTALMDFLGVQRDANLVEKSLLSLFSFLETVPFPEEWMNKAAENFQEIEKVEQTVWGKGVLNYTKKTLLTFSEELRDALKTAESENIEIYEFYKELFEGEISQYEHLCEQLESPLPWDDMVKLMNSVSFQTKTYRNCPDVLLKNYLYGGDGKKGKRNQIKEAYRALCKEYFSKDNRYLSKQLKAMGTHMTTLFTAVNHLRDYVARELKLRNALSFSDVEHCALQLLVQKKGGEYTPSPLAKKLQREIEYIFIDEYQDTNDLQDMIFTALSKVGGNLFIVGDIKQSIYSFRKAKPEIFMKKKETFTLYDETSYPAKIILGENFRSKKGVTQAINFVFSHIMSKQVGEIVYNEEERLIAAKEEHYDQDRHMELFVLPENEAKDTATQEAKFIADKIHKMVENKTLIEKNGELVPCTYSDFAILLRSHSKTAHLYQKALQERGISAESQGGENLFDHREILTLLDFLKVVDNPGLDISVASVLLSDLFHMPPDTLLGLREENTPLYLSVKNSGDKTAKEFIALVERYRAMASVSFVFELIEDFLSYTKFESMVYVMEPTTYRLGNLKLFLEMAGEYSKTGTGSLSGFLSFVERLKESGQQTPAAQVPVLQSEQVQIMSVHKSKGLEFPVVILAGLYKKFNDQYTRSDILISETFGLGFKMVNPNRTKEKTLPYRLAALEEGQKSLSEEMRILYVALTRTVDKLMVFTFEKDVKSALAQTRYFTEDTPVSPLYLKGARNYAQWLLAPLLRLEETKQLHIHIDGECATLQKGDFAFGCTLCEEVGESDRQEEAEAATADPQLQELIRAKMNQTYPYLEDTKLPGKISVSALNVRLDEEGHTFKRRPKFLSQEGLTPAERGNAVHKFMQFANYQLAAQNPEAEIERVVQLRFISEEEGKAVHPKKIERFFQSPIGKLALNGECVYREYKLMSYIAPQDYFPEAEHTAEKILVQGIADCIVETDKGMVIIDYKTDYVKDEEELKDRYRHQLGLYKEAIEKSMKQKVAYTVLYSFSLDKAVFL